MVRNHRVWARLNDDEHSFVTQLGRSIGTQEDGETIRFMVQFTKMITDKQMVSFQPWVKRTKLQEKAAISVSS